MASVGALEGRRSRVADGGRWALLDGRREGHDRRDGEGVCGGMEGVGMVSAAWAARCLGGERAARRRGELRKGGAGGGVGAERGQWK